MMWILIIQTQTSKKKETLSGTGWNIFLGTALILALVIQIKKAEDELHIKV